MGGQSIGQAQLPWGQPPGGTQDALHAGSEGLGIAGTQPHVLIEIEAGPACQQFLALPAGQGAKLLDQGSAITAWPQTMERAADYPSPPLVVPCQDQILVKAWGVVMSETRQAIGYWKLIVRPPITCHRSRFTWTCSNQPWAPVSVNGKAVQGGSPAPGIAPTQKQAANYCSIRIHAIRLVHR